MARRRVRPLSIGRHRSLLIPRAQDLRRLSLSSLSFAKFRSAENVVASLASLETLWIVADHSSTLSEDDFFTPEVLPSLRRLYIADHVDPTEFRSPTGDRVPDLSALAGQLHHLSIDTSSEDFGPLLVECKNLLSFECNSYATLSSPPRSSPALIAIRIWKPMHSEMEEVLDMLKAAVLSGLVDSRTSVFPDFEESAEYAAGVREWARLNGVKLEYDYDDGASEDESPICVEDYGFYKFSDWVEVQRLARGDAESGRL